MDKTMLKQMRTLLDEAKKIIKTPDPISDINLFSILGMENKEVSAHSAFLYYILKPFPQEDGKVNDAHLKAFLKVLFPEMQEPAYADIYREYATDFGRLDFLIVFGKDGKQDAAVIELKIWAGEQPKQIARYRAFLEQKGYAVDNVFYLTPDQRKAETGDANNITLKKEIKGFLQNLSNGYQEEKNANYIALIKQYINLIDKLTGDDSFMAQGAEIFKSARDIQAADKLHDAKIEVLGSLINSFMEELQSRLIKDNHLDLNLHYPNNSEYPRASFISECEQSGKKYISDYYKRGKKYPALCFMIEDISKLKKEFSFDDSDTDLYFFIEIDWNLYAGFTLRQKKDNKLNCVSMPDSIKKTLDERKIPYNNIWLNTQYVQCDGMNTISFTDYQNGILKLLDQNNAEGMIFDATKIDSIADDIKRIFKEQCKLFFDGIAEEE